MVYLGIVVDVQPSDICIYLFVLLQWSKEAVRKLLWDERERRSSCRKREREMRLENQKNTLF